MKLGEYMIEAQVLPYSKEYFDVLKESMELELMCLGYESLDYLDSNPDLLTEQVDMISSIFTEEGAMVAVGKVKTNKNSTTTDKTSAPTKEKISYERIKKAIQSVVKWILDKIKKAIQAIKATLIHLKDQITSLKENRYLINILVIMNEEIRYAMAGQRRKNWENIWKNFRRILDEDWREGSSEEPTGSETKKEKEDNSKIINDEFKRRFNDKNFNIKFEEKDLTKEGKDLINAMKKLGAPDDVIKKATGLLSSIGLTTKIELPIFILDSTEIFTKLTEIFKNPNKSTEKIEALVKQIESSFKGETVKVDSKQIESVLSSLEKIDSSMNNLLDDVTKFINDKNSDNKIPEIQKVLTSLTKVVTTYTSNLGNILVLVRDHVNQRKARIIILKKMLKAVQNEKNPKNKEDK